MPKIIIRGCLRRTTRTEMPSEGPVLIAMVISAAAFIFVAAYTVRLLHWHSHSQPLPGTGTTEGYADFTQRARNTLNLHAFRGRGSLSCRINTTDSAAPYILRAQGLLDVPGHPGKCYFTDEKDPLIGETGCEGAKMAMMLSNVPVPVKKCEMVNDVVGPGIGACVVEFDTMDSNAAKLFDVQLQFARISRMPEIVELMEKEVDRRVNLRCNTAGGKPPTANEDDKNNVPSDPSPATNNTVGDATKDDLRWEVKFHDVNGEVLDIWSGDFNTTGLDSASTYDKDNKQQIRAFTMTTHNRERAIHLSMSTVNNDTAPPFTWHFRKPGQRYITLWNHAQSSPTMIRTRAFTGIKKELTTVLDRNIAFIRVTSTPT